jgi:tetratricopeptide (TPR) repeat protein
MAVARKSVVRQLDWPLWLFGAAVVLSLVGFGVYYYNDRYVHANESVMDRQARQLEDLVRQDPQNADLRVSMAAYYLDAGLVDLTIQQAGDALKIQADNQGALILLGNAYQKKGDLDTAVKHYTLVLQLNKDNPMASVDTRLEGVYYQLGEIYRQQNKPAQAIDALKSALSIDHTDADALYALGMVYQEQKDYANAVKQFEQALRFDPTFGEAYQGLATGYAALGNSQEAAYAQGMVTFTEGRYGEAATQLEAVVKQSPDLTQAYFGLGLVYEKLGKFDQSLAALSKFVKANPNDFAGQDALGRVSKEGKQ